jgi:hypothetical protein
LRESSQLEQQNAHWTTSTCYHTDSNACTDIRNPYRPDDNLNPYDIKQSLDTVNKSSKPYYPTARNPHNIIRGLGIIPPRFGNISPRVGNITPRLGNIPPRVGNISPRVGNIPPRFGNISPRVGNITPRLGNISPRVGNIAPRVGNLAPRFRNIRGTSSSKRAPDVAAAVSAGAAPNGRRLAMGARWLADFAEADLGRR